MTDKPVIPARLTITMKIEVNLQDLPPDTPLDNLKNELDNIKGWAQETKAEMEEEIADDPLMAARMKVSVEVDTHD